MSKKEERYNKHHGCPESRGGATNELNVEMIKYTTHQAIHTLFSNMIFPEKVEHLLTMESKILLPEIQRELLERLDVRDIHNPEERYKEGALLLPKRFKKGITHN